MDIDIKKLQQIEENILIEAVSSLVGQSCGRLRMMSIYLGEGRDLDPREDLWRTILYHSYRKTGEVIEEGKNANEENGTSSPHQQPIR